MQLKNVKLAEASLLQLRVFAEFGLGMDVPKTANADQVRKLIAAVHDDDEITVPAGGRAESESGAHPEPGDTEADAAIARAEAAGSGAITEDFRSVLDRLDIDSRKDPKITINIANQPVKGGERAVFVAVNGVGILLPRNREITVPYRFYEALRDAVATDYEQVPDEDRPNEIKMVDREMQSYPFTVIRAPGEAELAAWRRSKEEAQRRAVAAKRAAKARAA